MSFLTLVRKMIGATAGADGRSGYAPAPTAGQQDRFLRGDATWADLTGLNFIDAVAHSALPASATTAGDFYVITSAGAAYTIDWEVNDMAVWNGAAWKQVTPGTIPVGRGGTGSPTAVGARTNLDLMAVQEIIDWVYSGSDGGLRFDGVDDRAYVDLTGHTGLDDDLTICVEIQVPTTNPTVTSVLGSISNSATNSHRSNGLDFYISTSGNLVLRKVGATAGVDFNFETYTGFVGQYTGQRVRLVAVRDKTTAAGRLYCNGRLLSTTPSTAGTPPGWDGTLEASYLHCGLYSSGNYADITVYSVVLYNYAMTDADAAYDAIHGIHPSDQFGVGTPIYASDYSAGVDSWGGTDGAVDGNIDSIGGLDDNLRLTVNTNTAVHYASHTYSGIFNKRFRFRASGYIPSANSHVTHIHFRDGGAGASGVPFGAISTQDAWVAFAKTFICLGANAIRAYGTIADAPTAVTDAGGDDVIYLRGVAIQRVGAVVALNFTQGIGAQVKDLSPNYLNAELVGSPVWLHPKRDGQITLVRDLNHSAISSSPATTKLLDLPANCGPVRIELDRDTAFDGAITLDIGISGVGNKYVSAQAVDATGKVLPALGSQISESASASTPVYIKKSGATTQGKIKVRFIYEVRGA